MGLSEFAVIHATFSGDARIFFWLESQRFVRSPKRGVTHPFNLPGSLFAKAIADAIGERAEVAQEVLWLPSRGEVPMPSPQLQGIAEAAGEVGRIRLSKWEVNGVPCDPANAALLLYDLQKLEEGLGVVSSSDAHFWSEASRFMLRLAANKRVFPSLSGDSANAASMWVPLLDMDSDREELSALQGSMPNSAVAEPSSADSALWRFLADGTDALCRGWIGKKPGRRAGSEEGMWVDSLCEGSAGVKMRKDSLLLKSISSWSSKVLGFSNSPARLCLRLEEGESGGGAFGTSKKWSLKFLVQSRKDPSLMLPAGALWEESGRSLIGIGYEDLLAQLGAASKLYPRIAEGLKGSLDSLDLDAKEAFEYLGSYAQRLAEGGFGVIIPDWWKERRRALGVKVEFSKEWNTKAYLGFSALVDYKLKVFCNGREVSQEELEELIRLKAPLAMVNGEWIEVNEEQLKSAVKMLEKGAISDTVPNIIRAGKALGMNVIGYSGGGALGELLSGNAGFAAREQPGRFSGALRDYQKTGFSWLGYMTDMGFGCCLADDMGLGKTIEVIAYLLSLKEKGETGRPSLIVCPTSVITNWQREIEKFAPGMKVMVHHGTDRLRGKRFLRSAMRSDAVISSYALLSRDEKLLSNIKWRDIILDEAQNIKNEGAKQSMSAKRLAADRRIALTGTPIENRLLELKSIFDFLNPGYFGSVDKFKKDYSIPIERYGDDAASAELKSLVNPFILRRVKTDRSIIRDLPDKQETKVYCAVTKEQATLYSATVDDMIARIAQAEGMERKSLVLGTMIKLKQLLDHPSLLTKDKLRGDGRSGKLVRLFEMLEEVYDEGARALIFTQFIGAGQLIKEGIERRFGGDVPFLHGSVPRSERDGMIKAFQEGTGPGAFVISTKAGGFGLNLTAASYVFHFDRWWNPAVENQATDRAHRIGQTKNVQVYKFVSTGTLEEHIDRMLTEKSGLFNRIIGSTSEAWITELSTDKLRDIFRLRADISE